MFRWNEKAETIGAVTCEDMCVRVVLDDESSVSSTTLTKCSDATKFRRSVRY